MQILCSKAWTSRATGREAMQTKVRMVAMNKKFMYYDYSKIMLAQLVSRVFLQTYWLILTKRIFQKF